MGGLVVTDAERAAREVVSTVGMRQRNGARTQAGKQQERDAGSLNPRRHEHELSLTTSAKHGDWQR